MSRPRSRRKLRLVGFEYDLATMNGRSAKSSRTTSCARSSTGRRATWTCTCGPTLTSSAVASATNCPEENGKGRQHVHEVKFSTVPFMIWYFANMN